MRSWRGTSTATAGIDLAIANYTDGTVSVLLGNGDGTFQTQAKDEVGAGPDAIVAGDFNGDGRTDLAIADVFSDEISVLLGNGDGTFQPAVHYAVGTAPGSIVAGDFNDDGRLDLAVVDQGNEQTFPAGNDPGGVSVLLGNGDGTFQPAVQYAAGTSPVSVVAGDFNGDGRLDLAVAYQGNEQSFPSQSYFGGVSVLLGNGDGTFQSAKTVAAGIYGPLVAGDFNGDRKLDLAVANSVGNVSILLGHGDGTFQPAVEYSLPGNEPDAIVAGDFNGDGRLDLAVAGANNDVGSGVVSVLLGKGDGTFQPAVDYTVGNIPDAIVTGDFNGDGRLDLAVVNNEIDSSSSVSVLLGIGDGTFQPARSTTVAEELASVLVAGDFNGDGYLDVAVATYVTQTLNYVAGTLSLLRILLGNSDGTFSSAGQLSTNPQSNPLVADVNGDGTDDVLVVDGAGDILYRQGVPGQPGNFEPPVTVNPTLPDGSNPYTSRDIAWLPNTDQGPVLASVDAKDNAISFYAFRDGGFVRLIGSLTTGEFPAQIIAADLNGDGLTDLVVRNAGDGTLSVYFGGQRINSKIVDHINALDPPTFLPPVILLGGLGVSDVQTVDTTGSGTLDLVVTNALTGQLSILRNLGDGAFAPPVPYRAGTGLSEIDPGSSPEVTSLDATVGVAAGSFTPDGPTDLVTINPGSNTLDVLAGLGGGRFANPVAVDTQSPAEVVRVADFNRDGIADLAVLTANELSIYLGNGKGGFASPMTYTVPSNPTA